MTKAKLAVKVARAILPKTASESLDQAVALIMSLPDDELKRLAQAQEDKVPITRESTVTTDVAVTTDVDLSKWQTWAKVPPGHCACGLLRSQCEYHKW